MEKEQNKYGWKGVYKETIKNTFISKDFENRDRYEKRHTGRRLRIICGGFQRGYQPRFQGSLLPAGRKEPWEPFFVSKRKVGINLTKIT